MFARWWFQIFFVFTPIWGRFPFWRAYFSIGLVQPPTSGCSHPIFFAGEMIQSDSVRFFFCLEKRDGQITPHLPASGQMMRGRFVTLNGDFSQGNFLPKNGLKLGWGFIINCPEGWILLRFVCDVFLKCCLCRWRIPTVDGSEIANNHLRRIKTL